MNEASLAVQKVIITVQRHSVVQRALASRFFNSMWGTDVEIAQKRVRDSEVKLQKTRELTRVSRSQWELLSQEIATYKAKIERASRGSEEFVDLVKKEADLIQKETSSLQEYKGHEAFEKAHFEELLSSVREAQEEERNHKERLRLWSMVVTIVGPVIGYAFTMLATKRRFRMMGEQLDQKILRIEEDFTEIIKCTLAENQSNNNVILPTNEKEFENLESHVQNLIKSQKILHTQMHSYGELLEQQTKFIATNNNNNNHNINNSNTETSSIDTVVKEEEKWYMSTWTPVALCGILLLVDIRINLFA